MRYPSRTESWRGDRHRDDESWRGDVHRPEDSWQGVADGDDQSWRGEVHFRDWPEMLAGPEYWMYKKLAETA